MDQWEQVLLDVNRPFTNSPLEHGAVRAFAKEITSIEDWKDGPDDREYVSRSDYNSGFRSGQSRDFKRYPRSHRDCMGDDAEPICGQELVPMFRGMDSSIVGDWTEWLSIMDSH